MGGQAVGACGQCQSEVSDQCGRGHDSDLELQLSTQREMAGAAFGDHRPLCCSPVKGLLCTRSANIDSRVASSTCIARPHFRCSVVVLVSVSPSMDEVIFFRRPSDASHFLLFNLPHPPHPLALDDDALTHLCSQYGLLFQCTIHTAAKDDIIDPPPHHRTEDDRQQLTVTPSGEGPDHTSADSLPVSLPSPSHPTVTVEAEPPSPKWAHVHYFSVVDARAAMQALRRHFHGSDVRSVWSRGRREPADEEGHITRTAPRFWPISFATSLQVMNHFVGPLHWSCEIKWTCKSASTHYRATPHVAPSSSHSSPAC